MIQLPDFHPSVPTLIPVNQDQWTVEWDRQSEREVIEHLVSIDDSHRLIILRNIDVASEPTLTKLVADSSKRNAVSYNNVSTASDVWQVLCSYFLKDFNRIPDNLALCFLSSFRHQAEAARIVDLYSTLRQTTYTIYKENKEATVNDILLASGLTPSGEAAIGNQKFLTVNKYGDVAYQEAFNADYLSDIEFRNYIDSKIFILRGRYTLAETILAGLNPQSIRVVFLQHTQFNKPSLSLSSANTPILHISVVDSIKTAKLIDPIWRDRHTDSKSEAFVKLVIEERARGVSTRPLLLMGEKAIIDIVSTIKDALDKSRDISSIQGKSSPVDVDVVQDRLVLAQNLIGPPATFSNDTLDAMRMQYHADAARLSTALIGTNAGGAFVIRLKAVEATLAKPFSNSTSILFGDQARALEVMLPSVTELVTDVTAADVGAFVSGLGLLSRQFPAWRDFLNEARDTTSLSGNDKDALNRVGTILESQSEFVVDPSLKAALIETRDASANLEDTVLDFAYVRTIGNVFRAIGRYLHDRAGGTFAHFNKALDEKAGDVAASALISLVKIASAELVLLAVGLPLEFGWIYGLGLVVKALK